jgi:outer membrane biosynthesis protein TonB
LQSHGTLAEVPLRSLLEAAQGERSTGTLTVRNGNGQSASLYFLFGHLFHAQGNGTAGDDTVVNALHWTRGDFEFDAKAKLPADETVKAGIPELVHAAEATPKPARAEAKSEPKSEPKTEPVVERVEARPERKDHAEPEKKVEAPQPRRGVKHRPQPKHGREPIPVPAGQVIYDSLKTSFVDFPRLITTLEKEGYTGYVRLLTDDASGLILFREGSALECMYDGPTEASSLVLGKPALKQFNDDVTAGHGVLDVVGLSPELIDGLYELTVSRPMYTELYAAWVDMKALLKFLSDRKLSGSVMIRANAGTGVIILSEGELAGAYTSESRDISDKPDRALALCDDPNAMIEVKSADASKHTPLDVDEVVSALRGARNPQPAPAPAPSYSPPATETVMPTLPTMPTMPPPEPPTAQFSTSAVSSYSAPTPPSLQVAPTTPPMPAGGQQLDWAPIVAELQAMAEDALGNRARKVKDILGAADPSQAGIEAAIDQIPSISLLFVDSSRLEQLAQEMRARLKSHL